MMRKFPFYKQADLKDCGPTCLKIISKFYGRLIDIERIRRLSETRREGTNLLGISRAADSLGYRSRGLIISFEDLVDIDLPCIVHWRGNHFVVVYKIKKGFVYVADPAFGLLKYEKSEFISGWINNDCASDKTTRGVVLILEPTPEFYNNTTEDEPDNRSISFFVRYLSPYRSLVLQLILGLAAGSLLQLVFPFLTQSIVDVGIKNSDIDFIYIILLGQIMLFFGRTTVDIIRSWILLHLSVRINISMMTDFFVKLMRLPISFFDTRITGDILQRINDHSRIERLLTQTSLNILFSLFNIVLFSAVLIYYDAYIFFIFFIGSFLYVLWIVLFLRRRKELDYRRFSRVSEEQSQVIEIINGMQEIKLHNAEVDKRWKWELTQIKLFNIAIKSLTLEQYQNIGSSFINEVKNIYIIFFSAVLVINNDITLGMMLSIQYIIGQLNNPISQLVEFIRNFQDAKISIDRLNEIHSKEDEDVLHNPLIGDVSHLEGDLNINELWYRYRSAHDHVLKDLNFTIKSKKCTAIIGSSGSGKTTLMKLLLKYYEVEKGTIKIDNININNISPSIWRDQCGVVMQDGYIFNDTIVNNITMGQEVDLARLDAAIDIANIQEFVNNLPLGANTKIGNEGLGISGGQRQRILIARAVYKSPRFIFFDEATSSLDANNEKTIMAKMNAFLKGRTSVIIAHRLSTVQNADTIIVLDSGSIVEVGSHEVLVAKRGYYWRLVKNQLDLGDIKSGLKRVENE